jgi:hypothetical protein
MAPRLCKDCHERPVSHSRQRIRDYRCARCASRSPGYRRAMHNWRQTPNGKAANARHNARRIFAGVEYHSCAESADQATAINRHIKERRRAVITRLKN